jgi:hypothetical protein
MVLYDLIEVCNLWSMLINGNGFAGGMRETTMVCVCPQ